MKMVISNSSSVPIYEQIKSSIIEQIMSGELKEGDVLPSIRTLASDIKISVMTINKAYVALEEEGYIVSIQGKGTFIASRNSSLMQEQAQKDIEEYVLKIIALSKKFHIEKNEVIELFNLFYRSEE